MLGFGGFKRRLFGFDNYLPVTVDLSLAAWNTVASHKVINVTGLVRLLTIFDVTEALAGGAGAAIVFKDSLGNAYCASQVITNLSAAVFVDPVGTVSVMATANRLFANTGQIVDVVSKSTDIGYEVTVNPLTDGTMVAHCYWTPISVGATVAAGTGGVL